MKFFLSVRKSIFIPLNLNDCKLTCAGPNQVTPSKTELAFEIPLTIALDLRTSTASSGGIRSRNSTNQNAPHNRPGAAKLGTQNPVKKKHRRHYGAKADRQSIDSAVDESRPIPSITKRAPDLIDDTHVHSANRVFSIIAPNRPTNIYEKRIEIHPRLQLESDKTSVQSSISIDTTQDLNPNEPKKLVFFNLIKLGKNSVMQEELEERNTKQMEKISP